jgi:hypothetical protein
MTPSLLFAIGELGLALCAIFAIRALCRESYRRGRWHGLNEARVDMQIERGHAERRKHAANGQYHAKRYGYFPVPPR